MRYLIIALLLLTGCAAPPRTNVGVGVAAPGVSVRINLPAYPDLVLVPGYPVYYAPGLSFNFFFYDGLYWIYYGDYWYSSYWYNGPWDPVHPYYVPVFILRVPVRYYRVPPPYFRPWHPDRPPRWNEHWGREWEQRRSGWNQWNRSAVPAPAPLPLYQRDYSGPRYPHPEQQRQLNRENYRYQPGDSLVRERERELELERERNRERPEPRERAPAPPLREQPTMRVPPNATPNSGAVPPQMRREEPQMRREEPQMRREEVQRPAANPTPAPRAPVMQEPMQQRREPQRELQTPRRVEGTARERNNGEERVRERNPEEERSR